MSGDLDKLADLADASGAGPASDGGAAPGVPPPAEPAISPNYQAIGFALSMFVIVATKGLKVESLERTMTEGNIEKCAAVLAPVADKWGLNLATTFDGPEWKAAFVAGPILWTAARELNAELRARRGADDVGQAGDGHG